LSLEPAGYPYGSLANYALDEDNAPLFLISDLAEHTANLKADPKSSLLIAETDPDQNPLARGRVTLLGTTRRVDPDGVRERYLARLPKARYYVDFKDFHFYRLEVEAVRFIGGFGRMSWVEAGAWRQACPDPVVPIAAGILEHMNEDHREAMVLLCKHLGGVEDVASADMTEVDRYGFEMQATTPDGPRLVRLGFPQALASPDDVRPAMVAMVRQARAAG
jgi:putative heme iron utilization protein